MRRSIAAIVIIVFIVVGVVAIDYYLTKDNVTVSGRAGVTYVPGTIIQKIEFVDTQGGVLTAFQFHQDNGNTENYSVTLKNGHTYNVYITFCVIDPKHSQTHFTTVFHVNAASGQTAITKEFWYPNYS
jgi:hypothetical protein